MNNHEEVEKEHKWLEVNYSWQSYDKQPGLQIRANTRNIMGREDMEETL